MSRRARSPTRRRCKGSAEIGFTILSMTLSLAAVFIPIVFMGGIVGRLLHEFAVTIMMAILISGFVSVTLTPMLCARFLKDEQGAEAWPLLSAGAKTPSTAVQEGYDRTPALEHEPPAASSWACSSLSLVATRGAVHDHASRISCPPTIPARSTVSIAGRRPAPPSTRWRPMHRQVAEIVSARSQCRRRDVSVGSAAAPRTGTNTGSMLLKLEAAGERNLSAPTRSSRNCGPSCSACPASTPIMQNPPAIRVGGTQSKSAYQYTLQDTNLDELQHSAAKLMNALQHAPGFADVTSDMDLQQPGGQCGHRPRPGRRAGRLDLSPIETALGACLRRPAGFHHLCQRRRILGDAGAAAAIPERHQRHQSLYISSNGSGVVTRRHRAQWRHRLDHASTRSTLVPLSAVTSMTPGTMPLSDQSSGPAAGGHHLLQPAAGLCAVSDAVTGDRPGARPDRHARHRAGQFQGTAAGVPELDWPIWACCSPSPS